MFKFLEKIKGLDKCARIGVLTSDPTEERIQRLKSIGGEEMAPKAESLTPEIVENLRANGLGVRAWGVFNTELMEKMCTLKVDGMTVNFPDKLFAYLNAV